jgi:uncharacterized protein (DUF488 family)
MATVYTIGHSRHRWEHFLALLKQHRIARVVDARSRPFSRFNPHFNRERLRGALAEAGIAYDWRGEALGGRPDDLRFLREGGALDLDALWRWPPLVADLETVAARASDERQALLCAEENPLQCHRRFLLTPPLVNRGIEVLHIRGDGRLEPEKELAPLL